MPWAEIGDMGLNWVTRAAHQYYSCDCAHLNYHSCRRNARANPPATGEYRNMEKIIEKAQRSEHKEREIVKGAITRSPHFVAKVAAPIGESKIEPKEVRLSLRLKIVIINIFAVAT